MNFIYPKTFINENEYNIRQAGRITHYLLKDGRIWSVKESKFVTSVNDTANVQKQEITLEELINALDFYHYPKGELKTDEEFASEVREQRDKLLDESDYLAMPDYPISEEKKSAILSYRQSLRDISKQSGFPRNINWPVKPEI